MATTAQPAEEGVFELGLVMAGAVSAGAYTAGVMDFLLEALDLWEQAKAAGRPVPRHSVRIPVLAGASAGGMTAAVLTAALSGHIPPIHNLDLTGDVPEGNPLFDCWVRGIDITDFLQLHDLDANRVESLLCCARLDVLAKTYMRPRPGATQPRPYIPESLHVLLTLANLRGTPYRISFKGAGNYGHPMSLHKDYAHCVYQKKPGAMPNTPLGGVPVCLDPAAPDSLDWAFLKTAALATGAFPLALAPRVLRRYVPEYELRKWLVPHDVACDAQTGNVSATIRPELIDLDRTLVARGGTIERPTMNVDGGTFDNEPLELARRLLAGSDLVNPRDPDKAHRAVLLIDPFPNPDDDTVFATDHPDVLALAAKLLGAMKANARFKAEELVLAQEPDCFSRFIIGPTREGKAGKREADIACGSLGGFGGFFAERFRRHDFQLGRRNCQRFLAAHFAIPLGKAQNNPVFKPDWDHLSQFAVPDPSDPTGQARIVPIIPLMPEIDPAKGHTEPPLPWDEVVLGQDDLDTLRHPIRERVKAVAAIYLDRYIEHNGLKKLAQWYINDKSTDIAGWLLDKVRADFLQNGVMR